MRKPTVLDWLGATVLWFGVSVAAGVFVSEGIGAPEELGVSLFVAMFAGGIAGARIWWLRRPEAGQVGLTTGEANLTRMEDVEMRLAELDTLHARVAELEERLDFSERLLVSGGARQGQERPHA